MVESKPEIPEKEEPEAKKDEPEAKTNDVKVDAKDQFCKSWLGPVK